MSDATQPDATNPEALLATRQWGPDDPDAPRALLVHGITSSAATMWELGEGLAAAGWSVTAADLPGHGRTGARSSYRFAAMAEALAALGDHWDLYVGHSLGGAVGVVLAAEHPGLADRYLLIDPALHVEGRDADEQEEIAQSFVDGLAERDHEEFAREHPRWHPRTIDAKIEANTAALPDAIRAIVLDNNWDVRDQAAALTAPVHVLVADTDSVIEAGTLEAIRAAGATSWTWETVPETTHSVHRDRPDVALAKIVDFAQKP